MAKRRWVPALGAGLLAGIVAAFIMTLVLTLLRLALGVPLIADVGSDRFLPTFNVGDFLALLGDAGGLIPAKRTAFLSGFGGQLAAGVAGGLAYAVVVELSRRRDPEREWRFGINRAGALFVSLAVAVLWIATVIVLWPVLAANNLGLPPVAASISTAIGLLVAYASFGVALILVYRYITSRSPLRQPASIGQPVGRRAFLAGAGGLAVAMASAGGIRKLYNDSTLPYDGLRYSGADVKPITPNDSFYVVTKNIVDPYPKKVAWRLRVDGLVDTPTTYDFDDIASMPSVDQEQTLSCISNAVWSGTPLRNLLVDAGPKDGVVDVKLHAADGYTHVVAYEKIMEETTFLAYGMNGEPLPQRHGFPARILVPGYYGESSVKWVTRIELFERDVKDEYYQKQGWNATRFSTLSRFDNERFDPVLPAKTGEPVTLKGIAFSGDRGISKVEVSTDGGGSWEEASIDYSPSRIAWSFWSHEWRPEKPGDHMLVVRATDGDGEPQIEQASSINPDGSSGYHKINTRVGA